MEKRAQYQQMLQRQLSECDRMIRELEAGVRSAGSHNTLELREVIENLELQKKIVLAQLEELTRQDRQTWDRMGQEVATTTAGMQAALNKAAMKIRE